jgi:hypothetical protein
MSKSLPGAADPRREAPLHEIVGLAGEGAERRECAARGRPPLKGVREYNPGKFLKLEMHAGEF